MTEASQDPSNRLPEAGPTPALASLPERDLLRAVLTATAGAILVLDRPLASIRLSQAA